MRRVCAVVLLGRVGGRLLSVQNHSGFAAVAELGRGA